MVRKSKPNLEINTATKKSQITVINLSKLIDIPVSYLLNGKKTNFILLPSARRTLPEGASLLTKNSNLKVVIS